MVYSCYLAIDLMSSVVTNGLRDQGSIAARVIPKTQHYKVRVKWSKPGNGVAPSPTHQFSGC